MKEYRVLKIYSEELKREVRVFMSLPKSYFNTDKYFPVLYMHDGQNLFDDRQASFGKCWGILDTYEKGQDIPEVIVVGLESVETRNEELVPYKFSFKDSTEIHGGNTDNYLDFIVKTLKPYIDNRFKTLKSAKNTGIMGSSFGGVCSLYSAMKYNEHFTRFGCVSSAFYPVIKQLKDLAKSTDFTNVNKLYLDVGTKETENEEKNNQYVALNQEVYNVLKDKMEPEKIKLIIIENAIHNEVDWAARFPDIIKYLFKD